MTFDTHLINVALAGLGISAGIAVLIAVAAIGVAVGQLRGRSSGGGSKLIPVPADSPAAPNSREREPQAA
jgi:hypothetical protein